MMQVDSHAMQCGQDRGVEVPCASLRSPLSLVERLSNFAQRGHTIGLRDAVF
jgi:hypothetical protein